MIAEDRKVFGWMSETLVKVLALCVRRNSLMLQKSAFVDLNDALSPAPEMWHIQASHAQVDNAQKTFSKNQTAGQDHH